MRRETRTLWSALVLALGLLFLTPLSAVAVEYGADYLFVETTMGDMEMPMVASTIGEQTATVVPDGSDVTQPGSVTLPVHVPVSGQYNLWLLIHKPSASSNQFRTFVVHPNGTVIGDWLLDTATVGEWTWVKAPATLGLNPLTYSVAVGRNVSPDGFVDSATGTLLGKILVTNDLSYSPPLANSAPMALSTMSVSSEPGTSAMQADTPWALNGISPVAYYFRNLDESVSSSSGLLTVRQQDLSAVGRDLNLNLARVYTTPALFRNGTPYKEEASPYANMGGGWALDLPWISGEYLHWWGGQQFKLELTKVTSVLHRFENHRNGHFVLTKHLDAVPHWFIFKWYTYELNHYELSSADGTHYKFDANGYLTEIKSQNGSTIGLSYSNGRLAKIIDTIGRTLAFNHASGRLDSVILTGPGSTPARIVRYGYSGDRLTTVDDPIAVATRVADGHRTTLGYDSTNSWLLSSITYATGGTCTYTYNSCTEASAPDYAKYWVTTQRRQTSPGTTTDGDVYRSYSYTMRTGQYWFRVASTTVETREFPASSLFRKETFEIADSEDATISRQTVYTASGREMRRWDFAYNANNELTRRVETRHGSAGAAPVTDQWEYDTWGNVTAQINPLGHRQETSYANGGGWWSSDQYYANAINQPIHDRPTGSRLKDAAGATRSESYYLYDQRGNLRESKQSLDKESLDNPTAKWLKTEYQYSSAGDVVFGPTKVIKGVHLAQMEQIATDIVFDAYRTFPNEQCTVVERVLLPDRTERTDYPVIAKQTYHADLGVLASKTDPNGNVTEIKYDLLGRPTLTVYPERADVVGRLVAKMDYLSDWDAAGKIVPSSVIYYGLSQGPFDQPDVPLAERRLVKRFRFDGFGRLKSEEAFTSWDNYLTDRPESRRSFTYDWQGLADSETLVSLSGDGSSYTKKIVQDMFGRLVRVTNWANNPAERTAVQIFYDDARDWTGDGVPDGTAKTVLDESLHKKEYMYDWLGRLVRVREYPDPKNQTAVIETTYEYDPAGNLLKVTDGRGQTRSFEYDSLGRLLQSLDPAKAGQTWPNSTKSSYDDFGRLKTRTDRNGASKAFHYDRLNRLASLEKVGETEELASFKYDPAGNRVYASDKTSGTEFSWFYDSYDRVIKEQQGHGGKLFETSYAYDDRGFLSAVTSPSGKSNGYEFNDAGRLEAVRRGPDPNATPLASFEYYSVGFAKKVSFQNGIFTQYDLDPLRARVKHILTQKNDPSLGSVPVLDLSYDFHQDGNIRAINFDTFVYDGLDRLGGAFVY